MATNFCFQCPLRCSLLLCFGLDINLLFLVRFPVKSMWIVDKPRIFRQRYLGKSWGVEPTLPFLVRILSPRAQDNLELQRNPVSTNYQRSRVKLWCLFFLHKQCYALGGLQETDTDRTVHFQLTSIAPVVFPPFVILPIQQSHQNQVLYIS